MRGQLASGQPGAAAAPAVRGTGPGAALAAGPVAPVPDVLFLEVYPSGRADTPVHVPVPVPVPDSPRDRDGDGTFVPDLPGARRGRSPVPVPGPGLLKSGPGTRPGT